MLWLYFERDKHEVCSALLTNIPQSCIINIKIAERLHFNDSYQKKKKMLCDGIQMLANAALAVIPQYIRAPSQHADTPTYTVF